MAAEVYLKSEKQTTPPQENGYSSALFVASPLSFGGYKGERHSFKAESCIHAEGIMKLISVANALPL